MSSKELTKTSDRKRRTESKEVRRKQLIDATIESISKNGISGTTMTTITQIAGLSIGLVNFHFKSKEALFDATLRHLADEHRQLWKKNYDNADLKPEAKLLAIADASFHARVSNKKTLAVWFAFYGEPESRKKYLKLMKEIDPERWGLAVAVIDEIIASGKYRDLDAKNIADTLESLYDGFSLAILLYPKSYSRDYAKNLVLAYLSQIFPNNFQHPA